MYKYEVTCTKCQIILKFKDSNLNIFDMMKTHMERMHNNSTIDSRIATFYFTTNPTTQPPTLKAIWYQEVNNARTTLKIARVTEVQDLPKQNDKSVSTSVKKGYYVDTHLVVATKETAFGSKSWTPSMGVTLGKGDYGKEDQVRTQLNNKTDILGKQNVDPDHVLSYFSYQKAIPGLAHHLDASVEGLQQFINDNQAFPDIEQYRRVSKYNLDNPEGLELTSRGQADADLQKYLIAIKAFKVERIASDYEILMKNLWSIFHQIIKIHELLYLAKITHGDMHMGNIKVIVINGESPNQGVVVKAFDFGKAKYRSETENYTRQDLEYLLQRSSVGGAVYGTLEDGKRHVWRSTHNPLRMNLKSRGKERDKTEEELKMETMVNRETYMAGPLDEHGVPTSIRITKVTPGLESKFGKASKSMDKHFPLHHLLKTMAWVHANKTSPANPLLIETVLQAQALIDRTATPFLNYLGLIRKSTFKTVFGKSPPEIGDEVSSIKNAFSTFANTMTDDINLLLSENPDQALLRSLGEFGFDIDDIDDDR